MTRKTLLAALAAAGSLASLVPTAAQAQYNAIVATAPPPPVREVLPAERPGYVWAPGHYEWRGDRYVWRRGHWMEERVGYEYREPRWVQRRNGDWVLVGGDWVARHERYARNGRWDRDGRQPYGPNGDRDGDGIANADDRDRDGDGVRNRYDRFPNDPSRW